MDYIGKVLKIEGDEITFKLDDRLDVSKLSRLSDGSLPLAEIKFDDQRRIRAAQRKKIWALLKEIALWSGFDPIDTEQWLKAYFMAETGEDYFSLSDCSVTLASDFISYLIEYCFKFNVPFKDKAITLADDVSRYLWLCIKYRKCCICGREADIHHAENTVGMGRNRRKISHSESFFIALCRQHHNEAHNIGEETFEAKYHLRPIKLSPENIREFKIGKALDDSVDGF